MAHDIPNGHCDSYVPNSYARRFAAHDQVPTFETLLRGKLNDVVRWMEKGGPWRSFLVTSVGVILLLAFTGIGVSIFLFVTALVAAVAVGFLVSLALVGSLLALFFTFLATIYLGALAVAALTISAITFLSICAIITGAGWIAFLWIVWQGLRNIVVLIQGSLVKNASPFFKTKHFQ